jgi:hypothetical protein
MGKLHYVEVKPVARRRLRANRRSLTTGTQGKFIPCGLAKLPISKSGLEDAVW